jgi:spermidine/putrescine transport system substrate-binding protein
MTDRRARGLSRREILRRGGAVLVAIGASPALLSACGGDDDEEATTTTAAAGDTGASAPGTTSGPAAEASGTTGAATSASGGGGATPIAENGTVGGTIDFISWEGYDVPDVMAAWKEENGVELKSTYISTHDDIQAKLIAAKGEGGWDLTAYYQGYKPLYRELDILAPLDPEQVPNLANVYELFQGDYGNFWVEPDGTRTGVPWNYGAIGITWDDSQLSGGLTSWYDLLDPKFKGKVAAVDDPAGNLALISHIHGFLPDQLPKDGEEIEKIKQFLADMWAQTTGISASYGDMTQKLTSGDAMVCFMGWAAMNSFAAEKGVTTVKTTIPEEGS